jgi:hypothetical protein
MMANNINNVPLLPQGPPPPPQGALPPPPPPAAALGAAAGAGGAAANPANAAAAPAIHRPAVADANANAFLDITNAAPNASLNERVTASAHRVAYAAVKNVEGAVTNAELGEQFAHLAATSFTSAVANQMIPITVIDRQAQLFLLMTQISGQIANLQTDVQNLQTDVTNLQTNLPTQAQFQNLQTSFTNLPTQAQFQNQLLIASNVIEQAIREASFISDRNSVARTSNSRVSHPAHSIVPLYASIGPSANMQPNPFPATYGDYAALTPAQKTLYLAFYGIVFQGATVDQMDDMLRSFLGLPLRG